jgi:hypothetical protein
MENVLPLLAVGVRDDELPILRKTMLSVLASELSKADRVAMLRFWNRLNRRMERAGLCLS